MTIYLFCLGLRSPLGPSASLIMDPSSSTLNRNLHPGPSCLFMVVPGSSVVSWNCSLLTHLAGSLASLQLLGLSLTRTGSFACFPCYFKCLAGYRKIFQGVERLGHFLGLNISSLDLSPPWPLSALFCSAQFRFLPAQSSCYWSLAMPDIHCYVADSFLAITSRYCKIKYSFRNTQEKITCNDSRWVFLQDFSPRLFQEFIHFVQSPYTFSLLYFLGPRFHTPSSNSLDQGFLKKC